MVGIVYDLINESERRDAGSRFVDPGFWRTGVHDLPLELGQ